MKQRSRQALVESIGMQVVRFQDESAAFDDVAAQILALHRGDLACMTMLLFGGAASVGQLAAALHVGRGAVTATIERLQLAGYARRRPESGEARIELTEHAREWIRESDHSLAEIAVECGFGTQSRLTTTFRRRTGFTPAEYRRGRSRSSGSPAGSK
jgi:AraC-like DNA-binding protein